MSVKVGDVFKYERRFTEEEVFEFANITGDKGRHHMEYDENGRLMVHGLLTASIGTKVGEELHYIARELVSEFIRPVFTGDTITCELTLTNVEQMEGYKKVSIESVYRNQYEKTVLVGTSYGVIRG
ncbi:enoyl-CoA hydratase [Bacillus cereus]|uniref:MaoC/PaaZ C-terminal domain-containing protein n=1 Tax=Bacillus cereus group TaxID=86661 RepID=UPI000BEBDA4C|nr:MULTISPECIES: MaoC/PaaZ C-terminal domain-containing protein [Bacillus cereus group]MED0937669.1 MaoC/PaaZ C-terminal domain-containing protein [Bacillus mobilis]MED0947879.1 MaoC/PaaZ C-terminal domain-containing protein [Bacillus mobilis]MED0995120.1 MaoC/PaaZ C-terminal domain-containing protein [Bacillus mobilis]MED0999950.1 MaoC/PaaZ C-terminal domain-containing protein [Bacillus mobilis]PEC53952.1 enoyl-CoA hydratase [Bacillus cereus]